MSLAPRRHRARPRYHDGSSAGAHRPRASGKPETGNSGAGIVFVLIGLYFLSGACFALASAHWPTFMPDEIDAVAVLLKLFGEPAGTYFAAAVMGLVGAASIYVGARPRT